MSSGCCPSAPDKLAVVTSMTTLAYRLAPDFGIVATPQEAARRHQPGPRLDPDFAPEVYDRIAPEWPDPRLSAFSGVDSNFQFRFRILLSISAFNFDFTLCFRFRFSIPDFLLPIPTSW